MRVCVYVCLCFTVPPRPCRKTESRKTHTRTHTPSLVCTSVCVLQGKRERTHTHARAHIRTYTSVCVRGGCALAVAVLWKCTKTTHKEKITSLYIFTKTENYVLNVIAKLRDKKKINMYPPRRTLKLPRHPQKNKNIVPFSLILCLFASLSFTVGSGVCVTSTRRDPA